jgi:hypothetical protein
MPSSTPEAKSFLELIFAGKPDTLFLHLWIVNDDESCWFRDVESAAAAANSFAEQEVRVSTGLASRDYGDAGSCPPEEISAITGICVAIEFRSDAHLTRALPRTVKEALSILPPELPPTCVVNTGSGVQACWLFRDPYVFKNGEDRKQAASLVQRWNSLVRDSGRMRGWSIERVADLAYLVRVPGTTECTDPASPKAVTIHSRIDRRYSPSELNEYLDDQEVPDPKGAAESQQWAGAVQDNTLAINLSAKIADEDLRRLEVEPFFKNTWFRQRGDLRDQSQEQYDFALASIGIRRGFSHQQIIDLIIHHRRMHHEKQSTRLDYYNRILAKAASSSKGAPGDATDTCPGEHASKPNQGAPRSTISDRDKIALCDRISAALGVDILRMVKLSGKEPIYRMELPQGTVEFQKISKLIAQGSVRALIAARSGKLIPQIKPAAWREVAQSMLYACIVEDGGEELEDEGAARMYLTRYLSATESITTLVGQGTQDLRKPLVRAGRITVCATELRLFINTVMSQNLTLRDVTGLLSAIGAKMVRVRGNKIKEQGRWELPPEEFSPADYRA